METADPSGGNRTLSSGLLIAAGGAVVYAVLRWLVFGALSITQVFSPFLWIVLVASVAVHGQVLWSEGGVIFSRRAGILLGASLLSAVVYAFAPVTVTAWTAAVLLPGSLAGFLLPALREERAVRRAAAGLGVVLLAAAVPIVLEGVEDRFAREEFFAALDFLFLLVPGIVTALVLWAWRDLAPSAGPGRRARAGALVSTFILLGLAGGIGLVRAYQASFYPPAGPEPYPGISEASPFLCEPAARTGERYDGAAVFRELVETVAAKEGKQTIDYAFLALSAEDPTWREAYHRAFLADVRAGLYTQPANSVKYDQYLAAQQLYFFTRVVERYPELFSVDELDEVSGWIADVNRRALSVGWVDFLYALSFAKLPDGPYENQENGLGLLSLLQEEGLVEGELSDRNAAYLAEHLSGWRNLFRNSDDAIHYQAEWIENAWHPPRFDPGTEAGNVSLAFEWLAVQSPPSGVPTSYNPGYFSMATLGGLAYHLTGEDVYIWLMGRNLDYIRANELEVFVRPGMELGLGGTGEAPDFGSCLVYGNSGVPTDAGPLLPDKVVLRDGWEPDDRYLLLNLRFTGWHRYKATGSIITLHRGEPIVREVNTLENIGWLPAGRQLLRDKRIPRENLNGLVVRRDGMDAVVDALVGGEGGWAQDPPFYADVIRVRFGDMRDAVVTELSGWNGRDHRRSVLFYHQGPVIVHDRVDGPGGSESGITWHTGRAEETAPGRYRMSVGGEAVELVLLGEGTLVVESSGEEGVTSFTLVGRGDFEAAAVFLFGEDVGSEVVFDVDAGVIRVGSGDAVLEVEIEVE